MPADTPSEPGSHDSSGSTLRRILAEGDTSARYRIEGEVARGGMGAILKVWDDDLRRTLAMKVVLGKGEKEDEVSDNKLVRFLEEAQITGQLDHPGVVPVHELGLDASGRVYFTMQLVKGRDLKEIFELVREGREGWNVTRALGVVLRVCEAMAFAHEKGVIHRDLKPANVMVGRFGETYVMDWGLAKVLGREDTHDLRIRVQDASLSVVRTDRGDSDRSSDSPLFTMDGDVVGTPCYMPPEQAKGQVTDMGPRSDVYSVGAMLYELLSGRAPYVEPGEQVSLQAVLGQVLHSPPLAIEEIDPKLPSELVAVCEKAMARDPAERYESMLLMAEDLRAYLEDRVVRAYETGAVAEFRKWVGRNRGMAASMAAAALAIVLGLSAVAWVQSHANDELKAANLQIANARDDLLEAQGELIDKSESLASANAELELATERAREQERNARRRGYSANLAAAEASLSSHQASEAVRRLEQCDQELRGWEWQHLRLTADSSLWKSVVEKERAAFIAVTDAVISPDGGLIAAATGAKTIQLLRTADGEVLESIGDVPATSLDWTPDGALLVAGCGDRRIRIYDAASGAFVRGWRAHRSHVQEVAVSPDGRLIASASGDKLVKLWTLEGQLVRELEGHTSRVSCVDWDPTGARVASGSRDRTVRIWNVETGATELVIAGHQVAVGAVAFGPTGALIASTAMDATTGRLIGGPGRDSAVLVWDAGTGERVGELRGHTDGIPSVDFAPDGRIVTASMDRTIRVWDLESGRATVLLGHGQWVTCASFSPDGQLVVSGAQDLTVRLWDPAAGTGMTLAGHPRTIIELVPYEPDRLLSMSQDGSIRLWDTHSGEQLHVLRGHDILGLAADYAPGSGRLVTVGAVSSTGLTTGPISNHGYLWDLATRTRLTPMEGGTRPITCVAITPDGATIATGAADHQVALWDGRTGERTRVLEGHENSVAAVAIHPAGQLVVSDGAKHTYAWDLATGEATDVLGDAGGMANRIRFSPDGQRLLTCLAGTLVKLWKTEGFEELMTLRGHAGSVSDAVFSPGAERIATCSDDGTVRLWDPETGEPLLSLRAPRGNVKRLAFSPDGDALIGGYSDGRVHVWTAEVGPERSTARREARGLRTRAQPVLAAAFEREVEPERVAALLRGDRALDVELRAVAVRMAGAVEETPIQTEDEVWMAVRRRFAPTPEYEQALWMARLAAARNGDDEQPLRLVGMALYRLGRYEEALEVLERSHTKRTSNRRARPEVAAFLAMTHHRLGNADRAQQYLELIRGLMQISTLQANSDSVAFLNEAESLMAYR